MEISTKELRIQPAKIMNITRLKRKLEMGEFGHFRCFFCF